MDKVLIMTALPVAFWMSPSNYDADDYCHLLEKEENLNFQISQVYSEGKKIKNTD
jgi:hypothetical protein